MRLSLRNWLIRGLILAGVAALVACGWVANSWISPERVREQVIAALGEQLDGVDVQVGSAHMRILGGIAVRELKLVRRGDPDDQPFFFAPSAVLFHDKEQLNRGRLVIRKIGLENPDLRLERGSDGRWNLADILKPGPADRPVPTFVAKGATLIIVDRTADSIPEVRLNDARFTLLNDPLPILTISADATVQGFGAVQVRARFNRITHHASVGLELPNFPLGEVLPLAAAKFAPNLPADLGKLTAAAAVKADLTYAPEATPAWRHDVRLEIKDGRLEHADLPWPVEKLAVKLRSIDGKLKVEEATAKIGPAHVQIALETRDLLTKSKGTPSKPPANADELDLLEEHLQKLEVVATGLPLDDALFARLGAKAARARTMFAPTGTIAIGYKFSHEAAGNRHEYEVRPHSVAVIYEKFKYPVTEVQGSLKKTVAPGEPAQISVDLRGKAAGQPVTLNGKVTGDAPDPAIDLRLAGINLPLDDALIAALPGKYPDMIREFHATGRADLTAKLIQQQGINLCENEFRVEVRDAKMNYSEFPYPLEKVKGTIVVRTTSTDPKRPARPGEPIQTLAERDELILDGFTGQHAGAAIWLNGAKRSVPDSNDRKLILHVGGNTCPADADLKAALGALKLNEMWTVFSPRGDLTFSADLEILDRGPSPSRPDFDPPFNAAADLKLTFRLISGLTITPSFFAYEINDLSGWLEYKNGRVVLEHFGGRHGGSHMKLSAGDVRFYPDGVIWANLGGLELKPLVADAALLKALPGKLRSAVEQLQLKGSAELNLKQLVVLTPPQAAPGVIGQPPEPFPVTPMGSRPVSATIARGQLPTALPSAIPKPDPIVYWNADLKMTGASLDTGVPWEEVFGAASCRGRYEGTHLGLVNGNIFLDRAIIAKQPFAAVQGQVFAEAQIPDPHVPGKFFPTALQFAGISGKLFHGTVGGEARVLLGGPVCYELWLTATDVKLEDVAQHHRLASDADLKGIAQAQLRLFNRQDPKTGQWNIEGLGKIDVPTGRMYNLPVMLDLVKVLKLSTPDRTAFEEAHATFHVHNDRIKVDQLDLIGKALCVGGSGELDTSGNYAKFEFYTLYSEILARLVNTPVGDVSAFLSRGLFKIKMTRENGITKYKPEPVPAVTEPIKAITERLRKRIGRIMGK
ncbi:MAG TPA: hypothetical protein VN641_00360 [Urbifossiella sp.]|nr:hypothetical protein [Urbifossiella sp.]